MEGRLALATHCKVQTSRRVAWSHSHRKVLSHAAYAPGTSGNGGGMRKLNVLAAMTAVMAENLLEFAGHTDVEAALKHDALTPEPCAASILMRSAPVILDTSLVG